MTVFDLSGKSALVTGATAGMGLATAKLLARQNASLMVTSRNQTDCDRVSQEIRDAGGQSVSCAARLGHRAQLEALADRTIEAYQSLDILVFNAAIHPWTGPTGAISDETFERFMRANVQSAIWLVQKALPGMIHRGWGRIILISSLAALTGSRQFGMYAMTKAALLQLARNLAVEYGDRGIRTNAIAPDVHKTDMASGLWSQPHILADYLKRNPSKQIGEPEEVAGTILWLASEAGNNVNGQTIVVDGGYSINYEFTEHEP